MTYKQRKSIIKGTIGIIVFISLFMPDIIIFLYTSLGKFLLANPIDVLLPLCVMGIYTLYRLWSAAD